MSNELLLLLVGAIVGFFTALILEVFKYLLEAKRLRNLNREASKNNRSDSIAKFLRGDDPSVEGGTIPKAAWLKVVSIQYNQLSYARMIKRFLMASRIPAETTVQVGEPDAGEASSRRTKRAAQHARETGVKFLLGPLNIIGRSQTCDIPIEYDPGVSREHAMIRYEKDAFYLYDLGSTNGTIVNKIILDKNAGVALLGGEYIAIGWTIFEFGLVPQVSQTDQEQVKPFVVTHVPIPSVVSGIHSAVLPDKPEKLNDSESGIADLQQISDTSDEQGTSRMDKAEVAKRLEALSSLATSQLPVATSAIEEELED